MISKKSFLKPLESSIDKDHKTEIELCKKRIKANKDLSAEEREKYINILDKDNFRDSISR